MDFWGAKLHNSEALTLTLFMSPKSRQSSAAFEQRGSSRETGVLDGVPARGPRIRSQEELL